MQWAASLGVGGGGVSTLWRFKNFRKRGLDSRGLMQLHCLFCVVVAVL